MTNYSKRCGRAVELMKAANIDAACFVPGSNFSYLTGLNFHLMERPTLFAMNTAGQQVAIIPDLERLAWSSAKPDVETFYWKDEDGPADAFKSFAQTLGKGTLGVEGLRMRAAEYLYLREHWPEDGLVNADHALSPLRAIKDKDEISELRKAIKISENALAETFDALKVGETELDVSTRLKQAMLAHGASGFAFEPIVLTGGESANPHGHASGRNILAGQPLLIDFGAAFGAMNADITRTVFCQYATDEHAAIYETVQQSNEAGKTASQPGETFESVDSASKAVLENSPFANMILHKTGHSLGRDVHEEPHVMQGVKTRLEPGMVFTVEPGLYRENDIGIRIEDDVLITEHGHESLTTFPRELLTYG